MKKRLLKKAVALAIAVVTAIGTSVGVSAKEFSDVKSNDWYYTAVDKWSGEKYNVLVGDENGLFNPHASMTVAELAAVLSKTFGYTVKADIPAKYQSKWYSDAFAQAIAAGVISKTGNADMNLTRQEAVKIMAIAFDIKPITDKTTFTDNDAIGTDYVGYVAAFQQKGLVVGTGNGKFEPTGSFTRAQVIQILDNILGDITDKSMNNTVVDGSLIIRSDKTVLTNITVNGDLIVGQGVGDGNVTLDNVTVTGRLLVNGGGSHSITIKGGSISNAIVVNKVGGESVRLRIDGDNKNIGCEVNPNSALIISGNLVNLSVAANAKVEIAEDAIIQKIVIDGDNVVITVDNGGVVEKITINSNDVTVSGDGEIKEVVKGENSSNVVVTTGGNKVETPTPTPTPTPTSTPTPSDNDDENDNTQPIPNPVDNGYIIDTSGNYIVTTYNGLLNAKNGATASARRNIIIRGNVTIPSGEYISFPQCDVTIDEGYTVTINGAHIEVFESHDDSDDSQKSTLTVKGSLAVINKGGLYIPGSGVLVVTETGSVTFEDGTELTTWGTITGLADAPGGIGLYLREGDTWINTSEDVYVKTEQELIAALSSQYARRVYVVNDIMLTESVTINDYLPDTGNSTDIVRLIIEDGVMLSNNATITVSGRIDVLGTLVNNGTITGLRKSNISGDQAAVYVFENGIINDMTSSFPLFTEFSPYRYEYNWREGYENAWVVDMVLVSNQAEYDAAIGYANTVNFEVSITAIGGFEIPTE